MNKYYTDHYYAQGQHDGADGSDYNQPYSSLQEAFIWSENGIEQAELANEAYRKGFENAYKQR